MQTRSGRYPEDIPAPAAGTAPKQWSAEVNDRAIAAMSAEIGGDEARTRFSLVLSGTAPYQYFLLADPYRVIIDISDVDFRCPRVQASRAEA